jgi:diguanylate cyclase (GGDEF)-like protein/PAS domain S-box-containing protein
VTEPAPLREGSSAPQSAIESPPASYAGRTRYTQLEYEALLANASIGIAFTRDRRFFLCNQRFAEMFGYAPDELIGQPGEVVYASRESYAALGQIAVPVLNDGRQLDLEWEVRRKDGSTFVARIIAKALDSGNPQQGTVWIVEDITEKRRQADEVARLLREQQAILGSAAVGIVFVKERRIVRCNRRYEQMYGYGPGELDGKPTAALYTDISVHAKAASVYNALSRGETSRRVELRKRKDGSTLWTRIGGSAVDPGDPHKGSVWVVEDITEERRAEDELQRALAEQELILDNATVGIAFLRNRVYQRCNPRFEQMFGYGPAELIGCGTEVIYPSRQAWDDDQVFYEQMQRGEAVSTEREYRRKDGSLFWCKLVGKAIDAARPDEGSIWIYDDVTVEHAARESLERSRDALERAVAERTAELQSANQRLEIEVGERKMAEQRARHLADHDPLTGLPNRRLLEDRLTQALALSYRNRKQTAVMFVDLDRFKTINDSLGHAVGDLLLKEVALRLVNQLRTGDTICRIGGDEFVVVLPEIKRASDAAQVAQKVIEELSRPIPADERELTVTPSIGIAVFPDDGRDAETLIRNSDAAMYHAKEKGRANYQFFTAAMNQAASRRIALESGLRRALGKDELRVHYQPLVDARTGRVSGHEALVRWQHPERGLVPPAEFIQLAEETGMILKLGEWVLREACRWATFIGVERGLHIAVNLSPRQFNDPKLVQVVAAALQETGLPARLLELEITEATAMQHSDIALGTLKKLKQLGVSISIDDFGTGYSSLSYLKRFPVDKLKVDRSFTTEIPGDADQCAIVSAIVALAHALDIQVIAEGVETDAQRDFLRDCGCDYLQGYLTGKPADADTASRDFI